MPPIKDATSFVKKPLVQTVIGVFIGIALFVGFGWLVKKFFTAPTS